MRSPHARPSRTVRIDGIWIGLALMVASALVVLAVGWLLIAWLFSQLPYIPSQP